MFRYLNSQIGLLPDRRAAPAAQITLQDLSLRLYHWLKIESHWADRESTLSFPFTWTKGSMKTSPYYDASSTRHHTCNNIVWQVWFPWDVHILTFWSPEVACLELLHPCSPSTMCISLIWVDAAALLWDSLHKVFYVLSVIHLVLHVPCVNHCSLDWVCSGLTFR